VTLTTTVNSVIATKHPAGEAAIRRRIDRLAGAISALDLAAVMSIYTTDVVSFDVEPPLQHVGTEAKRKNW
jgi:ketosteroid isomerase-like protein